MKDFNISSSSVNITVNENAKPADDKLRLNGYIYVVDDEPMMAQMNSLLLEHFIGVRTRRFTNPCEAMAHIIAHKHEVSGIVTDAFMFSKDCGIQTGIELVHRLYDIGVQPPALFVTGLNGNAEKMWMMERGFFAEKPLEAHLQQYANNPVSSMPLFLFFEQVAGYDRTHCS